MMKKILVFAALVPAAVMADPASSFSASAALRTARDFAGQYANHEYAPAVAAAALALSANAHKLPTRVSAVLASADEKVSSVTEKALGLTTKQIAFAAAADALLKQAHAKTTNNKLQTAAQVLLCANRAHLVASSTHLAKLNPAFAALDKYLPAGLSRQAAVLLAGWGVKVLVDKAAAQISKLA